MKFAFYSCFIFYIVLMTNIKYSHSDLPVHCLKHDVLIYNIFNR